MRDYIACFLLMHAIRKDITKQLESRTGCIDARKQVACHGGGCRRRAMRPATGSIAKALTCMACVEGCGMVWTRTHSSVDSGWDTSKVIGQRGEKT